MKAVVFAGQGCQRKGMGLEAIASSAHSRKLWTLAENRLRSRTGVSITEVIRDNPQYLHMYDTALKPHRTRIIDTDPNYPESHPKPQRLSVPSGVLGTTYVTQPAVLTAQIALFEWMKEVHPALLSDANVFAGHSLGEFTALCAMGLFPLDIAAELTFRRGAWMEAALTLGSVVRPNWQLYAVNPSRAKLSTTLNDGTQVSAEDVLAYLVELISMKLKHTTSWVEIVNYNVGDEQLVVAGDEVALSILGKCIDPLYRVNSVHLDRVSDFPSLVSSAARDTQLDIESGANDDPNAPPPPDFVPASWHAYGRREIFQRRLLTLDDGKTLPLERLTHLTLENEGKSGLKKKSWFIPLPVDVPFHSSHLRRAMDNFHQDCLDALPSEEIIRKVFEHKKWVTNLTGSVFDPNSPQFLNEFSEAVRSENIGERSHSGKYASTLTATLLQAASPAEGGVPNIRNLAAATMTAQLAHPVQWIDSMRTITNTLKCTSVTEISPTRTLSEMFKKCVSDKSGLETVAEHVNGISGIKIVSLPTEISSIQK